MSLEEAIDLISPVVRPGISTWADVGAGTGIFTEAILRLQPEATVYALDKSPHMLWSLQREAGARLKVLEGDFTKETDLPMVQGMLMANALHYAPDPLATLEQLLKKLDSGGSFLLIEYDTEQANPPWVPYPVSLKKWLKIASEAGLIEPTLWFRKRSAFGSGDLYGVEAKRGC